MRKDYDFRYSQLLKILDEIDPLRDSELYAEVSQQLDRAGPPPPKRPYARKPRPKRRGKARKMHPADMPTRNMALVQSPLRYSTALRYMPSDFMDQLELERSVPWGWRKKIITDLEDEGLL